MEITKVPHTFISEKLIQSFICQESIKKIQSVAEVNPLMF